MNAYRTVAGRIRSELEDVERVAARAVAIWRKAGAGGDDYYVDATALNLHGFYAGIERILELIGRDIDGGLPAGARWTEDLLRQMAAEIPGVRPAVLDTVTRERLDRFRGFRHVVRNVYTYNLDAAQIDAPVKLLLDTVAACRSALLAFAGFLEAVAE